MKIIDVHAHYFPDSIAKETMDFLEKEANVKAVADGTIKSLREFMIKDRVALSINQPVATKKEQVKSINRKMIEFNKDSLNIISFGAMHPEFSTIGNVREEIEFIAKNGLKGIKLHAEYQDFYPDDMKVYEIYDACRKNNLIILFHAGKDLAYEAIHSTPERLSQVAKIEGLKLIFAHMGAYRMWDDVFKYLIGKKVYFDTSYSVEMKNEVFKEIAAKHGPEKILFGTDFPWESASRTIQKVEECINDANIKEMIYYANAEKLLNLSAFA